MDIEEIKKELATGAYVGMSDDAVASAIAASRAGKRTKISGALILKRWSEWMIMARCIETRYQLRLVQPPTPESMQGRVVLTATINNLRDKLFADLDPTDPDQMQSIAQYLAALIGLGVLTEAQKQATFKLAQAEPISDAPTAHEVWIARGQPEPVAVEGANG